MSAFVFFFDLCWASVEKANVNSEHHHLLLQNQFLTFEGMFTLNKIQPIIDIQPIIV